MKIVNRINDALEKGLLKEIFDHVGHLFICALMFAAGAFALKNPSQVFLGVAGGKGTGYLIIFIGVVLAILAIWDVIRRLSTLKYHKIVQIIVILIYLLLAMRVIEIIGDFREGIRGSDVPKQALNTRSRQ